MHFLIPATLVAAPWYVRNFGSRRGIPSFRSGIHIRTNPVHVEIMKDISNFMGYRNSPIPLSIVPWILMATSGAVVVLGTAGLVRMRFRNAWNPCWDCAHRLFMDLVNARDRCGLELFHARSSPGPGPRGGTRGLDWGCWKTDGVCCRCPARSLVIGCGATIVVFARFPI